jgi:hypothetical protein
MMWEGFNDSYSEDSASVTGIAPGIDAAPVAPAFAGATAFFAKRFFRG